MAASRAPLQFISVRNGAWIVQDALPPRTLVPSRRPLREPPERRPRVPHVHPRHHFNEPTPAQLAPFVPPAPPVFDKKALRREHDMAKGDREQGIMVHNARLAANKELNATAFEDETPWGGRPERANLGHSAVKSKGWK